MKKFIRVTHRELGQKADGWLKRAWIMALVVVVGLASVAVAAPEIVMVGQRISGFSPLGQDCGTANTLDPTGGLIGPGSAQIDSEVEPHVAVNPTDRDNIVAAWIQDRNRSGGGGRSNLVAVTFNGGKQWETVLVPGVSECTEGRFSRATDPWVDFSSDGVAYLASLTFEETEPSAMIVSVSHDGGRTWSAEPSTVSQASDLFQDKEQLSTHPRIGGRAYMTWMQRIPPGSGDTMNATMFSTTEDHGETWTTPRRIFVSGAFIIPEASEIMVLPDDSLLYIQGLNNNGDSVFPDGFPRVPMVISARRSTDEGETWSPPVVIATRERGFPRDPENPDMGINGGVFFDVAMAPDGTAYVVWSDHDSDPRGVAISKSTDGGLTWSEPGAVATGDHTFFLASVAVGHRGTVGVSFYDLRNDQLGDAELTTDAWFAYSRDEGSSWMEQHLAGPFDLRRAPTTSGYFLGDYAGLDAASEPGAGGQETFASAISVSPPVATAGASDVWFSLIRLLPPQSRAGNPPGSTQSKGYR